MSLKQTLKLPSFTPLSVEQFLFDRRRIVVVVVVVMSVSRYRDPPSVCSNSRGILRGCPIVWHRHKRRKRPIYCLRRAKNEEGGKLGKSVLPLVEEGGILKYVHTNLAHSRPWRTGKSPLELFGLVVVGSSGRGILCSTRKESFLDAKSCGRRKLYYLLKWGRSKGGGKERMHFWALYSGKQIALTSQNIRWHR